jgi:hypothetical protein
VPDTIHLRADDDWPVLRDELRRASDQRVILVLPWDAQLLSNALESELAWRAAHELGKSLAVVSPDPERRSVIRRAGLSVFATVEGAEAAAKWKEPPPRLKEPPPKPWWEEEVSIELPRERRFPAWLRHIWQGARLTIFLVTLLIVAATAIVIVPRAEMTLIPAGQTVHLIVPVSAQRDLESVDTAAGLIPARRVGEYFEGYIEVETTGVAAFSSGRATGTVLFTNLLAQDVTVPAGTVVRTSSGSFPVRFSTLQDVVVPALGQASAPIEATQEGPSGNVGTNQINRIEGIAGLAIRVSNPEPTFGGATQDVRAVSQADMDRAQELLTDQLLNQAYEGLQPFLEPTEWMPSHSLAVQSVETSYNRFLMERADTLGLHMRVLVTGLAIDEANARAVAYARLRQSLPEDYRLVGSFFELGEMAETPEAPGDLTVYVTATGYAAAELNVDEVKRSIRGREQAQALDLLGTEFPLAERPQLTVWPDWFPRVPLLPIRIAVDVTPRRF